jgi:hypothetical protein
VLKLKRDEALSNFAFKFNLCHCSMAALENRTLESKREMDIMVRHNSIIGRFRYIAWVECPYIVAGKASSLRAEKRAPG